MKGCNSIKELIDQADKPELLPFEVAQHIRHCGQCEAFAEQRAGLRRLLASGARVTVPMNFDAVLSARLTEAKARPRFAWLSPAVYLRFGAATAGLVVMIFAAQYAGLFSERPGQPPTQQDTTTGYGRPNVQPLPPATTALQPQVIAPANSPSADELPQVTVAGMRGPRSPRGGITIGTRVPARYPLPADDGGVVLVRGSNGDMDVPMPTVSVGAQPLLYVNAGKRPARNVGASF